MHPVIYVIQFPSGREYVGCSVNLSARLNVHVRHMRAGRHENHQVQAAYNEEGAPEIRVVACGFDRATLHELESAVMRTRSPALNLAPATPVPASTCLKSRPFGPYLSMADAARGLGVPYQRMKKAARRNGYDYEKTVSAVTMLPRTREPPPQRPKKPPSEANKIVVRGILDFAKNHRVRLGVSENRYRKLLKLGLDPFAPANIKAPPMSLPRMLTIDGKTLSLTAWCRLTGTRVETARRRLDHNKWTPAQAVGLEMPPREQGRPKNPAAPQK